MAFSVPRLSPAARIALGLVSQVFVLVLVLGILLGVMPDRTESTRQLRSVLADSVARQSADMLQAGNPTDLKSTLQAYLNYGSGLRSIGIRKKNGQLVAEAGSHQTTWQAVESNAPSLDQIIVPISANGLSWGAVELAFRSIYPDSLVGWLSYPPVAIMILIVLIGFVAFYLYLRRVLEYLDPLAVIPERIRAAYDTFLEAVLILDTQGRIVLANQAFRKLHPLADGDINGKAVSNLEWLVTRMPKEPNGHPWNMAMQTGAALTGTPLDILQPEKNKVVETILNCTPIQDGLGRLKGCLVIFSDVTELHRSNRKLRQTLDRLAASQQEIEKKNRELERLATRDPLTGCLNRRALFAAAEPIHARSLTEGTEICCIMGDIDHFKLFNDRYGHAVGDLVIQAVARIFTNGLRPSDLLCRYGGEEFCIFLPGMSLDQAMMVAERLRSQIEEGAGKSIRSQEGLQITSSFGVASIKQGAPTPNALIDFADQALYRSKQTGRNRVSVWNDNRPTSLAIASLEQAQPAMTHEELQAITTELKRRLAQRRQNLEKASIARKRRLGIPSRPRHLGIQKQNGPEPATDDRLGQGTDAEQHDDIARDRAVDGNPGNS